MLWMLALTSLVRFSGLATDENGQSLYKEEYTVTREDAEIVSIATTFYDPSGDFLGRLVSEFNEADELPDIHFEKDAPCYFVEKTPSLIRLFSGRKEKTLPRTQNMTCGHGLYNFVIKHLQALISGQTKTLNFIMPQRLTTYTFLVSAKLISNVAHIEMVLKNPWIRPFAPKIEMRIDPEKGSILSYKGIDGFLGRVSAKNPVMITYSDPEPIALPASALTDDQSQSSHDLSHASE